MVGAIAVVAALDTETTLDCLDIASSLDTHPCTPVVADTDDPGSESVRT